MTNQPTKPANPFDMSKIRALMPTEVTDDPRVEGYRPCLAHRFDTCWADHDHESVVALIGIERALTRIADALDRR